jgi:hypothetical protein
MIDQARFDRLCRKLLLHFGNDLYPEGVYPTSRIYARLATFNTPDGKVFVKITEAGLHVSSPDYNLGRCIYHILTLSNEVARWDQDEANKAVPFLEQKLALHLLADV